MDERTYRRMSYGCSCGHVARSSNEEARHRHNFPLLCRRKDELPRSSDHKIERLAPYLYEISWRVNRTDRRTVRVTHRTGARRFARRWGLDEPT